MVLWAVESMRSMRINKIIFTGEMDDLLGAMNRPQAWPSFGFQVEEIELEARGMEEIRWEVVTRTQNRGATLIAQSVTRQNRGQSYVARSHPCWLFELFVNESRGL